jgi:hypothetical protein
MKVKTRMKAGTVRAPGIYVLEGPTGPRPIDDVGTSTKK